MIAVPGRRREVPIERLAIGNRVITKFGGDTPIRWIGRHSSDVLPVLFHAGSLAEGVPARDLFVSPRQAMYLDDLLIPAAALVNGTSVVQVKAVEGIQCFRIELATHDVILANGAWSETFVDDSSVQPCAPRIEDGDRLYAVRARLAARARPVAAGDAAVLAGRLDEVGRERISGWARDEAWPDRPVRLRVLDNGVAIGDVLADAYRPDLAAAGIGSGHHGFALIVPGGLSPLTPHLIRVQRASDGTELPNSPWRVETMLATPAEPPPVTALTTAETPPLGRVDVVTRDRVSGWARGAADSDDPVELLILDNGAPIAVVLANRYRADVEQAGIGTGRHSFDITIPGGLSPLTRHVIQVKRTRDGAELPGSPAVLEASGSFDASLEQAVASAIEALNTAGEQERALSFMMAQTDRLLQLRADAEGGRAERLAYRQFQRRWGPEADSAALGVADPGRRALMVDGRLPVASRDAGSQAIVSHLRVLQRLGYAVSLVAADELDRSDPALAATAITICQAPLYCSVEELLRRQAGLFEVVYLHRADIAARYLAIARRHFPRARILYSVADLHYLRLERQAAVEERPELLALSHRLRLEEWVAAWSADAVITHSAAEAGLLRRAVPLASVHQVAWDVPACPTTVPFARRRGVAFIGHYAHGPNVDAARWLVDTVMPLVWQTDPAIPCLLIGSDMPEIVRRLARAGVEAVGRVADLGSDVFDRVRLTVAPLRFGAGLKGKVLVSLAAGVPCVMSEVAAEGLALSPPLQAAVGRDAASLAALISRLHADEATNRAVAEAGLALIRRDFTPEAITAGLRAAIEGR